MNKKKVFISVITLAIDQLTKVLVQMFDVNISIIKGVFALTYYENTGAAWSILEGKTTLLIFLSIVMMVVIYSMMFSFKSDKVTNVAFGILFGGIIGNFIDRIFFGYVRDFININIFSYQYPIFNIADMAIVIGALLLVFITVKGEIKYGNSSRRKRIKD